MPICIRGETPSSSCTHANDTYIYVSVIITNIIIFVFHFIYFSVNARMNILLKCVKVCLTLRCSYMHFTHVHHSQECILLYMKCQISGILMYIFVKYPAPPSLARPLVILSCILALGLHGWLATWLHSRPQGRRFFFLVCLFVGGGDNGASWLEKSKRLLYSTNITNLFVDLHI